MIKVEGTQDRIIAVQRSIQTAIDRRTEFSAAVDELTEHIEALSHDRWLTKKEAAEIRNMIDDINTICRREYELDLDDMEHKLDVIRSRFLQEQKGK